MSDDDRLVKALAFANYKATMVSQRENLRLRFVTAMLHAQNGGIFTITPSLMSMVDLLLRQGHESAVLIDDKSTPIFVEHLQKFLDDILSIYAEATNDYLAAFENLRKSRSVESLIEK